MKIDLTHEIMIFPSEGECLFFDDEIEIFETDVSVPPVAGNMAWENGDLMLWENGDRMIWEG